MEWPFVRRSKYESVKDEINDKQLKIIELEYENKYFNKENQSLTEDIGKLINDTNRLNQELSNQLDNHRETKNKLNVRIGVMEDDLSKQQGSYKILELKTEGLECKLKKLEAKLVYFDAEYKLMKKTRRMVLW